MRAKWSLLIGIGGMFLGLVGGALALVVAMPQGPARFIGMDTILVGRVVGIEDQDREVPLFPGNNQKTRVRIAIVRVNEAIMGVNGKQVVRIAFQVQEAPRPNANGGLVLPGRRIRSVTLNVGQEGLFSLNKHHKEDFFLPPSFFQFTTSDAPTFAKEKADARKVAKVYEDPRAALTAQHPEEKMLAATVLIGNYRRLPPGTQKHTTEPIDAEESKLLLKALAEANWTTAAAPLQMHPFGVFSQLGVTEKDGYQRPTKIGNVTDLYRSAQQWLAKNQNTYRVQRLVPAK